MNMPNGHGGPDVPASNVENVQVHPVLPWLTVERRAWLYRVMTAVSGLATLYGVVAENIAFGWVALGSALISSGVATVHTPTS